ncbi:hypothetical protein ES708_29483 [subsurface metagenome]
MFVNSSAVLIVDIVGGYFIGKKILIPIAYDTDETMGNSEVSDDNVGVAPELEMPFSRTLDSVNLNPAGSTGEIFSCQFTVGANEEAVIQELEKRDPQIKDIILSYLKVKTVSELNDVSKLEEIKSDIKARINSVLTSGEITHLYVTDWILQFN